MTSYLIFNWIFSFSVECSFRMFLGKSTRNKRHKRDKENKEEFERFSRERTCMRWYTVLVTQTKGTFFHKQTNKKTWNKLVYCLCFIRGTEFFPWIPNQFHHKSHSFELNFFCLFIFPFFLNDKTTKDLSECLHRCCVNFDLTNNHIYVLNINIVRCCAEEGFSLFFYVCG